MPLLVSNAAIQSAVPWKARQTTRTEPVVGSVSSMHLMTSSPSPQWTGVPPAANTTPARLGTPPASTNTVASASSSAPQQIAVASFPSPVPGALQKPPKLSFCASPTCGSPPPPLTLPPTSLSLSPPMESGGVCSSSRAPHTAPISVGSVHTVSGAYSPARIWSPFAMTGTGLMPVMTSCAPPGSPSTGSATFFPPGTSGWCSPGLSPSSGSPYAYSSYSQWSPLQTPYTVVAAPPPPPPGPYYAMNGFAYAFPRGWSEAALRLEADLLGCPMVPCGGGASPYASVPMVPRFPISSPLSAPMAHASDGHAFSTTAAATCGGRAAPLMMVPVDAQRSDPLAQLASVQQRLRWHHEYHRAALSAPASHVAIDEDDEAGEAAMTASILRTVESASPQITEAEESTKEDAGVNQSTAQQPRTNRAHAQATPAHRPAPPPITPREVLMTMGDFPGSRWRHDPYSLRLLWSDQAESWHWKSAAHAVDEDEDEDAPAVSNANEHTREIRTAAHHGEAAAVAPQGTPQPIWMQQGDVNRHPDRVPQQTDASYGRARATDSHCDTPLPQTAAHVQARTIAAGGNNGLCSPPMAKTLTGNTNSAAAALACTPARGSAAARTLSPLRDHHPSLRPQPDGHCLITHRRRPVAEDTEAVEGPRVTQQASKIDSTPTHPEDEFRTPVRGSCANRNVSGGSDEDDAQSAASARAGNYEADVPATQTASVIVMDGSVRSEALPSPIVATPTAPRHYDSSHLRHHHRGRFHRALNADDDFATVIETEADLPSERRGPRATALLTATHLSLFTRSPAAEYGGVSEVSDVFSDTSTIMGDAPVGHVPKVRGVAAGCPSIKPREACGRDMLRVEAWAPPRHTKAIRIPAPKSVQSRMGLTGTGDTDKVSGDARRADEESVDARTEKPMDAAPSSPQTPTQELHSQEAADVPAVEAAEKGEDDDARQTAACAPYMSAALRNDTTQASVGPARSHFVGAPTGEVISSGFLKSMVANIWHRILPFLFADAEAARIERDDRRMGKYGPRSRARYQANNTCGYGSQAFLWDPAQIQTLDDVPPTTRACATAVNAYQPAEATYAVNGTAATRATINLTDRIRYVYKLQHRCRTCIYASSVRYECNDFVVVDGDLGLDMGLIIGVWTREVYDGLSPEDRAVSPIPEFPHTASWGRVYRQATCDEVLWYTQELPVLEEQTLGFLRQLPMMQRYFYACRVESMRFVGCELQADMRKVYVYFSSTENIRFLEVATYLNKIFHCRIWIHQVRDCEEDAG